MREEVAVTKALAELRELYEPFVNALWTFVLRMGLLGGWLPTIGDAQHDPTPAEDESGYPQEKD